MTMRRMMHALRGFSWHNYLLAVSVLALIIGVGLVIKHRIQVKTPEVVSKVGNDDIGMKAVQPSPVVNEPKKLPVPKVKLNNVLVGVSSDKCSRIEYAGQGSKVAKVGKKNWTGIKSEFHNAKQLLLKWLNSNRKGMPDKTASIMETRIKELKIQRPPTLEEPDLSWRGVLAWSRDGKGEPVIKVGHGFIKLARIRPALARYELARYLVMAWAPCELVAAGAENIWLSITKCLGVEDTHACADGSYSEAGWAVATALAEELAGLGCPAPALTSPDTKACLAAASPALNLGKQRPTVEATGKAM